MTRQRGAEVDDWSWKTTVRRVTTLARLTKPYKLRTALALLSLLAATATGLAPPFLAGMAVNRGIDEGDMRTLVILVIAFLAAGILNWLAGYAQTYFTGWTGSGSSPTCGTCSSAICSGSRSASTSGTAPA